MLQDSRAKFITMRRGRSKGSGSQRGEQQNAQKMHKNAQKMRGRGVESGKICCWLSRHLCCRLPHLEFSYSFFFAKNSTWWWLWCPRFVTHPWTDWTGLTEEERRSKQQWMLDKPFAFVGLIWASVMKLLATLCIIHPPEEEEKNLRDAEEGRKKHLFPCKRRRRRIKSGLMNV